MWKLERHPEVPVIYRRLNRPKQGRRTVVKQKLKPISSNYFKQSWLLEVMILQFAKARTTVGEATTSLIARKEVEAHLSLMTCVCVCVSLFFHLLTRQLFPGSTHLFIDCAIFPRNVWHDVGHSLSWYKIWYFLWNNLSLSPCYQAQSYVNNWSV